MLTKGSKWQHSRRLERSGSVERCWEPSRAVTMFREWQALFDLRGSWDYRVDGRVSCLWLSRQLVFGASVPLRLHRCSFGIGQREGRRGNSCCRI